MTGVPENERCFFCGGKLENRITTLPFVVGDSVIVIRQIPAEVCTQCGEAIVSSRVARRVDQIVKQAQHSGFEISIANYEPILVMA